MEDNFAGKHCIFDITVDNKNILNSIEIADKYMYEITEISKMQLVMPVISMQFPFNNELVGFVKKLQKENIKSDSLNEQIEYIKEKELNDTGISSFGIWNTSHCASHSWLNVGKNKNINYISIDLFSCKNYDEKIIINFTKKYYNTSEINCLIVNRYFNKPQEIIRFHYNKKEINI